MRELVDFESKKGIFDEWLKECQGLEGKEERACFLKICKQMGNFNSKQIKEIEEFCLGEEFDDE